MRASQGLEQTDLAEKLGKSRSIIAMYESGDRIIPRDVVADIQSKYPGAPPFPDGVTKQAIPPGNRPMSVTGLPLMPIKVIGSVGAGIGTYNVDPTSLEVYVPESLAKIGGLGWLIEGDSMMPDLEPDMIAIFREWRQPKPGFTFLLKGPDGDFRVKNLLWRNGGWIMESLNQEYPAEPLGDYQLLGFLIGWYRVKGKRETLDADPDGLMLRRREHA